MPVIIIDSDGIALQKEDSAFGESTTVETRLSPAEFEDYDLSLSTQGAINLGEFIAKESDEDGLSVSLLVSEVQLDRDAKHISATVVGQANSDALPPVPEIDIPVEKIDTDSHRRYYKSLLNNRQTFPKLVRQIVYEESPIQKGDLKERLEAAEYSSINTPLNGTLNVLKHLTGEIERDGSGDTEELRWIGAVTPDPIAELSRERE